MDTAISENHVELPPPSAAPATVGFDIFISYRHGGLDEEIATRLHRRLEAFRTPRALVRRGIAARLSRVFRDRDEFATDSDLTKATREALTAARYLVVVCSPRAKGSHWVSAEIAAFREMGKGSNILPLLIDGDPDIAFPPTLYSGAAGEPEPLAADIRADSRRDSLRALNSEILRILATVLGCRYDDLRQRQQERARRRLVSIAVGSVALAVVLAVLSGYALVMQGAAQNAERLAKQRLAAAQINQSKFLADAAERQLDAGNVDLASALTLVALPHDMQSADRPLVDKAVAAMERTISKDRLVGVLAGHTGYLSGAAYSPDGKLMATASDDGTARIWDAVSGAELHLLTGHRSTVRNVEFSPDGKTVLTASGDGTARIWDAATGAELKRLIGHAADIWRAHFSPDGKRIATAGWDRQARIWDAATGEMLHTLVGHTSYLVDAVFSPDGKELATIANDKVARLWSAETGAEIATLTGHDGTISFVTFSGDGTKVLTGGLDSSAHLWDAATGEAIRTFGGGDFNLYDVKSASFSQNGLYVVAATEYKNARIWEVSTGKTLRILSGHTNWVTQVSYSPDAKLIATGSQDGTVRIWDGWTGAALGVLSGHQHSITGLAWSPDSKRLLSTSVDNTARVWDPNIDHRRLLVQAHSDYVSGAHYSPDGRLVVTYSPDRTARLWDAETGDWIATLQGHTDRLDDAVFSPNGKTLATRSRDGMIRLWEVKTRKLAHVLETGSSLNGLTFSPDSRQLVSWSEDRIARLWDVAEGKELRHFEGNTNHIESVQWTTDGLRVVVPSMDTFARIYEVATGKQLALLSGHSRFVQSARFSRDGARVITGGWDGTARIWDSATGKQLVTLPGHADLIDDALFLGDGSRALTASLDGVVRIWDANAGALLRRIDVGAGVVNFALSPEETMGATTDQGHNVRVWNLETGSEIAAPARARDPMGQVAFSPDNKRILTSSAVADGLIWIFDLPEPLPKGTTLPLLQARSPRALFAGERRDFFLEEDLEANTGTTANINECDRLAANPFDPVRITAGVLLASLNATAAVDACAKAVEMAPGEPRFLYQLGRAYEAAQQFDSARANYQAAVDRNYQSAFMNLGLLYFNARGVERDVARASGLLRTAYEKGVVAAGNALALALTESALPADQAESRRIWLEAAERGDPAAQLRLARQADTEGQGADDGLAVFRAYAIAEWLYADVGATATAAIARARTATLARSLPPEAVAAAWAEVQMRKKTIAAQRRRGVAERLGGFWPSFFALWTERT
ncbi:WD40 repeat protein/tetratricopeptide (TPR) repeat protein [Bradyrhizobium sp. S3.9.2]|uniref:WD40 domain-containing protein n=1 Tax=Bradyrhizobium sp. S3.9.2 TaxID=3156432 RepID=UPI0033988DBC